MYDVLFGPVASAGRRRVVERINELEPSKVLEVGVGTGISLPHYDPRHRISGIDLSPEMLERAKSRVKANGLDNVVDLSVMDAQEMSFPDNSFEVVVAMYVLSVVPDAKKLLGEMRRVCVPGGKIFIVNHFSREGSFISKFEKALEPFSDTIGWNPHFPLDVCMRDESLIIEEKRRVPPVGVFTVLVCENSPTISKTNGAHPQSGSLNGSGKAASMERKADVSSLSTAGKE